MSKHLVTAIAYTDNADPAAPAWFYELVRADGRRESGRMESEIPVVDELREIVGAEWGAGECSYFGRPIHEHDRYVWRRTRRG